ncbi:unnamed protein product [Alopecurus aequalis]
MEELWKNMSLTSTPAALQYNLGSPSACYLRRDCDLAVRQPPRTPPHTATALTLSPSLEFTHLGHAAAAASSNSTSSGDDSLHHMPDPFGTDIFSSFTATGGNNNSSSRVALQAVSAVGGDRRQRRMVKNRESAARSRARMQAYTNQLELELAWLKREDAMLTKRQQDRHACLALASSGATAPAGSAPEQAPPLALQRCRSAPPPSL